MKITLKALSLILPILLTAATPVSAQDDAPRYTLNPPPNIDPGLPNVLLLGDSISIGYMPVVRTKLAGKANVYGIAGSEAATVKLKGSLKLDTASALEHLNKWLQDKKWAVIHFNWGLHDVKLSPSGEHQVPLEAYERNLSTLVGLLDKTHARLIWASTTPVPEGAKPRHAGDEIPYNEAALRVMTQNHIPVDDLHALVSPRLKELQRPANVHFTDAGSEVLGAQVATMVEAALTAPEPKTGN